MGDVVLQSQFSQVASQTRLMFCSNEVVRDGKKKEKEKGQNSQSKLFISGGKSETCSKTPATHKEYIICEFQTSTSNQDLYENRKISTIELQENLEESNGVVNPQVKK